MNIKALFATLLLAIATIVPCAAQQYRYAPLDQPPLPILPEFFNAYQQLSANILFSVILPGSNIADDYGANFDLGYCDMVPQLLEGSFPYSWRFGSAPYLPWDLTPANKANYLALSQSMTRYANMFGPGYTCNNFAYLAGAYFAIYQGIGYVYHDPISHL